MGSVFLAPLNQLRLEIDLYTYYFFQIHKARQDHIVKESPAFVVAIVEEQGPNQGFKGVSEDIDVMWLVFRREHDNFIKSH